MKTVKHYLITVSLGSHDMHAYVMTRDEKDLPRVIEKMFQEGNPSLPLVLQTTLSTGADTVRKIVSDFHAETKELLKTAKDFHTTIFVLPQDSPENKILMDLH